MKKAVIVSIRNGMRYIYPVVNGLYTACRTRTNGKDTAMSKENTQKRREELVARIHERLDELGLSRNAAELQAFGRAGTIRNWERPDKNVLPRTDSVEKLAPVLKTTATWLMYGNDAPKLVSSFDPDAQESEEDNGDWNDRVRPAAFINGGLHYKGRIEGASPEFPAAAGAGQGHTLDDRAARVETRGIATGHPVTSEWVIPPDFVRHGLGATPSQIALIPVVGHSMEPRLYAGDRVMVDLSQSAYAGDAIYVINDGDEVMKVKTLSKIAGSNPARFRIISEAAPDRFDELQHDDFRIIGRVVGRFSRM